MFACEQRVEPAAVRPVPPLQLDPDVAADAGFIVVTRRKGVQNLPIRACVLGGLATEYADLAALKTAMCDEKSNPSLRYDRIQHKQLCHKHHMHLHQQTCF